MANSDNLKEKIEQILCDGNDDLVPPISYQNVLDELLQLFQDYAMGCVPPERRIPNSNANLDYNQCRQDMLYKIKENDTMHWGDDHKGKYIKP